MVEGKNKSLVSSPRQSSFFLTVNGRREVKESVYHLARKLSMLQKRYIKELARGKDDKLHARRTYPTIETQGL